MAWTLLWASPHVGPVDFLKPPEQGVGDSDVDTHVPGTWCLAGTGHYLKAVYFCIQYSRGFCFRPDFDKGGTRSVSVAVSPICGRTVVEVALNPNPKPYYCLARGHVVTVHCEEFMWVV